MKGKYLITTSNWFTAPDGKQYISVWGNVSIFEDSILGIKTNRNSSNWYLRVGSVDKFVIITGCQVHYAVRCEDRPFEGDSEGWTANAEHGINIYKTPCRIYFAE